MLHAFTAIQGTQDAVHEKLSRAAWGAFAICNYLGGRCTEGGRSSTVPDRSPARAALECGGCIDHRHRQCVHTAWFLNGRLAFLGQCQEVRGAETEAENAEREFRQQWTDKDHS